jgi:hypothetical protein
LSSQKILLSQKRLILDNLNMRKVLESTVVQRFWVSQQALGTGTVIYLEEVKLRHRLREIAADHIRWGRHMAYRLLRREGWTVNHKRVQRLWREACNGPLPGSASGPGPQTAR